MSFQFNNKVVYLLSSDRWGTMRVSKHHYALELAEKGNTVFFIEPPDLNNKGITITPVEEQPSLYIVSYKPVYRGQRFLPAVVYRMLLSWQIRLLKKAIGKLPDVVISFDPYRFLNLKWFKAKMSIFFAADLFSNNYLPEEIYTADFCLAVSDTIVQKLQPGGRPVYFINHGLNRHFVEKAKERLNTQPSNLNKPQGTLSVGYVGNLLMEAPDRMIMRQVIKDHPQLQFVFWGQYEKKGNFVAHDSPDVLAFIEFLKSQPNVVLRGPVHPSILSEEIVNMDMFWLCWKINEGTMWDGSNSHKILEYLSIGKPVVSHTMSTYKNNNLIDMLDSKDNSGYSLLFEKVLERVQQGEPIELIRQRINFAIANAYRSHIEEIEELIERHYE